MDPTKKDVFFAIEDGDFPFPVMLGNTGVVCLDLKKTWWFRVDFGDEKLPMLCGDYFINHYTKGSRS